MYVARPAMFFFLRDGSIIHALAMRYRDVSLCSGGGRKRKQETDGKGVTKGRKKLARQGGKGKEKEKENEDENGETARDRVYP